MDFLRDAWRDLKRATAMLLAGAIAGSVLTYQYTYVPLRADVASGWCGKMDHRARYFEFACQDAFIAASLAQHDIEQDQIGALIQASEAEQPKAKKRK